MSRAFVAFVVSIGLVFGIWGGIANTTETSLPADPPEMGPHIEPSG